MIIEATNSSKMELSRKIRFEVQADGGLWFTNDWGEAEDLALEFERRGRKLITITDHLRKAIKAPGSIYAWRVARERGHLDLFEFEGYEDRLIWCQGMS